MRFLSVLLLGLLITIIITIPVTSSFHVSDKSDKSDISNYPEEEGDMSNSNSILSDSQLGIIQDTAEDSPHPNYIKTSELDLIEVDLSLYAETDFVSTWQTDLIFGGSESNQVSLPLESSGTYNFTVNWGDGSSDIITVWNQSETTHTYSTEGQYVISISGMLNGWSIKEYGDRLKIVEIHQWGNLRLGNSGYNFASAENLVLSATDAPNLTGITDLEHMFFRAKNIGSSGNLNNWDVSTITDMFAMFAGASSFNQSLNSWDVSQVTNMSNMFNQAETFNQPLGSWNVSQVTDMSHMFYRADSFDQPLGSWNVSQVRDMSAMFTSNTLSIVNYDDLLLGWSQLTVQYGVIFNAGSSEHSTDAQSARDVLTDTYGWTIYDKSNLNGMKGDGLISTVSTPIIDERYLRIIIISIVLLFIIGVTRMISRS